MKLGPAGTLSRGPKIKREDSDTTREGPADSKDMISDIIMGGQLNQIREPTYRKGGPTHWTQMLHLFPANLGASAQILDIVHSTA